nr:reverse transcriptase domain-containing protein [Tanacetum cinerariifolium]
MWWNSHVKTVGHDVAYGMPWKTLMKMMTIKYCPRSEIKKLEIEIWNLKVKDTDVVGYTQRFQELALMCGRMFPKEFDEVEKYVGGPPNMIQGNVMSTRPKTMQEAIKIANDFMDQKVRAHAERKAENKRKFDNNNQAQQQLPMRQNVVQAYTVGNQGHHMSDFSELRDRNHGNQAEDTKAHGVVYGLGGEETDQDPNNVEDETKAREEDFLASTSEP